MPIPGPDTLYRLPRRGNPRGAAAVSWGGVPPGADPMPRLNSRLQYFLSGAAVAIPAALPPAGGLGAQEVDDPSPPAAYEALRDARLEPAGRIENGALRIDRFEFELTGGDLYVLPDGGAAGDIAVYLGDGVVRCYPPDGVEHQQVEKFLDEDLLEERFDRFVFWLTGDAGARLRALAGGAPGDRAGRANDLLDDRREALLEHQFHNPDSRLLLDLLAPASTTPPPRRPPYFHAQVDADDHGWFSIEIEPRAREEVTVFRYDRRRKVRNVWMGFHALAEFDADAALRAFSGFPRDPETEGPAPGRLADEDDDDWNARDLGLPPRTLHPEEEGWAPRVAVRRTDVDLALEGNGDATGTAALLIEPLEPLAAVRLQISRFLRVTGAHWRTAWPANAEDVRAVTLLAGPEQVDGEDTPGADPSEPAAPLGDPLAYVQETHGRLMGDDLHERWVTVALPRTVDAGERFVLEITYEGELVERLRSARGYHLKDTLYWAPAHPDNRRSRQRFTFRSPERLQVASGMEMLDERVDGGTRISEWVSDAPVRGMSFSLGRFDVTTAETESTPPVTVYENRSQTGFAPGALRKTIEDLEGSIRLFGEYFGAYPYPSLLLTETVAHNGQAFPGMVLLSYQAFGQLHTGVSEVFRAHEVAHQWWGALVHWEDYRDQWISEGFSHYSAALYVLAGLEDEGQFEDILDAWRLDVLNEVNVGQGAGILHYGVRPEVIRESEGHESGPLVAGYRLNSTDTPVDYQILVYEKGAFILHMLRMMLTDIETGDDTRFREMMRQFVRDHHEAPASTRSFEAAVEQAFGAPMGWFFDQWVYGVDVPTYRPDLDVTRVADQQPPWLLHGTIRQEDVPDTFSMPVPILLRFADRPPQVHRIQMDAPSVEVEIPLPAEPTDIEFNYRHAVLAHVR